ncbi:MAG TPA: hypothetical protein VK568_08720 [Thermodesulfobacteriota bacterium]|jgi:hypothetical protein|nr:hypothetical protein [Thermodesulfobacteriota bacterium]
MIPISLNWDSREESLLLKWDGFFFIGMAEWKDFDEDFQASHSFPFEEVSILNLRRGPAMIGSFFGKIPGMMEKATNIVKGKKKTE